MDNELMESMMRDYIMKNLRLEINKNNYMSRETTYEISITLDGIEFDSVTLELE